MASRSASRPTPRAARRRKPSDFSASWTPSSMTRPSDRRKPGTKAPDARLMERLWFGDDVWARTGRLVLAPFEGIYGAVVRARGMLYDAGVLRALPTAVPAISVGNLSVGGTGKTPVAAWLASELAARGAHPAIVLRGYGE